MPPITTESKKKQRLRKSERADITFPVSRIHRYLKKETHKYRIGVGTAVYVASVLEYLSAEVLELAGNVAKEFHKSRITPRHILFAISSDKEFNEVFNGVTIASGGVIPHIHSMCLKKGKKPPISTVKSSEKIIGLSKSSPVSKKKLANLSALHSSNNANISNKKIHGISIGSSVSSASSIILSEKLFLGQTLTVVRQDITTVCADAIIHPTDRNFSLRGQIGVALRTVGGEALIEELKKAFQRNGALLSCDVAVSKSFKTASPNIIHVNSPNIREMSAYVKLETCVKNCLVLADLKNFKSVALPAIGSGRAGFDKVLSCQTVLKCIRNYFESVMSSSIKQIFFVLFDDQMIAAYSSEIAKINSA